MAGVYWIGADGNTYVKGDELEGVQNVSGDIASNPWAGFKWRELGYQQIPDPVQPQQTDFSGGGGGGGTSAYEAQRMAEEAAKKAEEDAQRNALRGEISGKAGTIEQIYGQLFGDLNNLVISRDKELESQYGDQLGQASKQYADALPEIDQSYAAIGSYDSTQRNDSRGKAKDGFEDTTKTIKKNKETDKAKLGQYKKENETKFTTDRDRARTEINRAGSTNELDALRGLRTNLEDNISSATNTRATLGTDGAAREAVTNLTKDGGRYEAAVNALDGIIKSSMGSDLKAAAVQAITDSAGLSDEEKEKVNQQYGNAYAEQQAL